MESKFSPVFIATVRNQARYYHDKALYLRQDAAEYKKMRYDGTIPKLTSIEQQEYDDLIRKVMIYEDLEKKERAKIGE